MVFASKIKVLVFESVRQSQFNVNFNEEESDVIHYLCLEVMINKGGWRKPDVETKFIREKCIRGALRALENRKNLSVVCSRCVHNGSLVQTLMHGSEFLSIVSSASFCHSLTLITFYERCTLQSHFLFQLSLLIYSLINISAEVTIH